MNKEEALYFKMVIGPAILEPIHQGTTAGQIDLERELLLRRAYERVLSVMAACPPSAFKIVDVASLEVPSNLFVPPAEES